MIKFYFSILFLSFSFVLNAQFFKQDFQDSSKIEDYYNTSPQFGQFNDITSTSNSVVTSISNGALRFNRNAAGTMYAYSNTAFVTKPKFVQLKFDFEASNHELNKKNVFSIIIGSSFSNASIGTTSNFTSRLGISTEGVESDFKLATIDNIGGAPSTRTYSGKQTITFVVNNKNTNQTYTAPNGNIETLPRGKMDVWIGSTRGINDFSLKNTNSPKGDITGFKIQATSNTGFGIFDFDNFEMKDLGNDSVLVSQTESLIHPHIWVSPADRQSILDNIANYDWASGYFDKLIERNESTAVNHLSNPFLEIDKIPEIPGDRTIHREQLNKAVESAILYYLTQDERYAQFSADILNQYTKLLSTKDPLTLQFYQPSFNHLIQCRELFTRVAMIYDFVQPYLIQEGKTVYDINLNKQVPFNFDRSQKTFEVMAQNVIDVGANSSNHPVLELPGGLYSVLCMEKDETRAIFFDKLLNGAARSAQPGINWMLDRFSPEDRLWPESLGYGKFTHGLFIQIMNIVDRYRPDLKLIENNKDIIESLLIYQNFKYPSGTTMAYGDINRDAPSDDKINRHVLAVAKRYNMTNLENRVKSILNSSYLSQGGYSPEPTNERLEWSNPLQLLWGVHIDPQTPTNINTLHGTVTAKHAGVVMQRNYSGLDDEQNGLMFYTHGGTYVHTHEGGIDMELFGKGYVMGPDYGADAFGTDIHQQYATSYAAHNTIIVNGTSGRGPKLVGNGTWQNITNEVVLEASEPKAYAQPIANNFSFSTQFLNDEINDLKQQRTNSIIRTSPTTGYYVDIFRSISNTVNNFHDYLFHGLGDTMQITRESGNLLPLSNTPNRYQNDIGNERKTPGWRWFTDAKTSQLTTEAVHARFDIQFDNKYMHVNVPNGVNREYTYALSPPTKAVRNGYSNKDTQVLVMRKYGEAWDAPFAAIYEPSSNAEGSVQSTAYIYENDKVVGVKIVSLIGDREIIDYIIANDSNNLTVTISELNASFTGRFGVIRTEATANNTKVALYIGSGQQIIFDEEILTSDAEGKAFKEFLIDDVALSTNSFNSDKKLIKLYPNPTKGEIELSITDQIKQLDINIFTLQGQRIKTITKDVVGGKVNLNLSDLSKGIYVLKLNLEAPIHIKVIKQ